MIELLAVAFVVATISYVAWGALSGWRERNALRSVTQEVHHLLQEYRQKAVDKGYNYGLLFSDDGLYVFEDSGGSGTSPFQLMNNYAIDPGEFSDQYDGDGSGNARLWRRVSETTSEFKFFTGDNAPGRILVMTGSELDLTQSRSGSAYDTIGTDITSSAVVEFSGGSSAPFTSGTLALFFSPDGLAYLKDPTTPITSLDKFTHQLGGGMAPYYLVRIAFDNTTTSDSEVPNYYEIAVNRYGSTTMIRWNSGDGGSSWNAHIQ
jgi:type II secretory pathway pseudopilin PulG